MTVPVLAERVGRELNRTITRAGIYKTLRGMGKRQAQHTATNIIRRYAGLLPQPTNDEVDVAIQEITSRWEAIADGDQEAIRDAARAILGMR